MGTVTHALATSVCSIVLLAGCGGKIPVGTDDSVKALVIEIARDEMKRQLAPVVFEQVTGIPVQVIGLEVTYESLVEKKGEDENAAKVTDKIDETVADLAFSLDNIRSESIDKTVGRSTSAADLRIGENIFPITYTAQLNDSGQLYVEVIGLRQ